MVLPGSHSHLSAALLSAFLLLQATGLVTAPRRAHVVGAGVGMLGAAAATAVGAAATGAVAVVVGAVVAGRASSVGRAATGAATGGWWGGAGFMGGNDDALCAG